MNISMKIETAGRFKLEAIRPDGTRRLLADWFDNLITDAGLDRMGGTVPNYLTWCQVGGGNTAPAPGDTALASRLDATNTVQSNTSGAQASAPYYGWRRKTFRLAPSGADRNYAEVGIGWASTGSLFSRALILDAFGSPTVVTVLSDESLDVTYELRSYPGTTDSGGVVTLDGVNYTWVGRCALVTSSTQWPRDTSGNQLRLAAGSAYTGSIGAITAGPSGTQAAITVTPNTYSSGSLQASSVVSASLVQANIGGIGAIQVSNGGTGAYQFGFTPVIPKDDTKILSLTVSFSWARKIL